MSSIISIPTKRSLNDNTPVININDKSGFVNDITITGITEIPMIVFGILIAFVLFLRAIPSTTNPAPCIIKNRKIRGFEEDDVSIKINLINRPTAIPVIPIPMSIDFTVLFSLIKNPFNMVTILIASIAIPGYMTKRGVGLVILKKR